jgi:hypothetical protein
MTKRRPGSRERQAAGTPAEARQPGKEQEQEMATAEVQYAEVQYPEAQSLPQGWELRPYTTVAGRQAFSVWVNGERISFGCTTVRGAINRAKKLMAERTS